MAEFEETCAELGS